MNTETEYKKIFEIVKEKLTCSAHNFDHVMRVNKLCIKIAEFEKDVDMEVLIPASLLHDIARVEENNDNSGTIDHAVLGSQMSKEILKNISYDEEKIEKIAHCILAHRFRTGNEPKTLEAKILFDADKLDAIGAVGVARTFMLSGQCGQSLSFSNSIEDYLSYNTSENGRIINWSKHSALLEYEIKLKKIPEKLYTDKAKEIGKERIEFMDGFFRQLKSEL